MKKLILLLLLLVSFKVISQGEIEKEETITEIKKPKKVRKIRPDHEFSFYLIKQNDFGDNFLSKAHKPKIGFGIHKNFINIYGFALGAEAESVRYRVTDPSLAGNIKWTQYLNFSGRIAYDYKLSSQLTLVPNIKIGATRLRQRSANKKLGGISGTSYTFGVNLAYNYSKHAYVFTGVNYNYTSYQVNSSPEYLPFFDKSNQIQIHLGIGFF